MTDEDVNTILSKNRLGEISMPAAAVDANLELMHNYVHTYVGGIMGQVGILFSIVCTFYEKNR